MKNARVCLVSTIATLALAACGHPPKLPDTEVLVAPPLRQDVPLHSEWVATLDGYVNAEIRPQVSGYLIKQNYKEGSLVAKGQVLFEIDPRPFQDTLDRAKAELAQAEAQLAKSTIDVERDTPLVAEKAVPKEKLDNEIQAKRAATAQVAAATAAVKRAALDLSWTKVTSLVDRTSSQHEHRCPSIAFCSIGHRGACERKGDIPRPGRGRPRRRRGARFSGALLAAAEVADAAPATAPSPGGRARRCGAAQIVRMRRRRRAARPRCRLPLRMETSNVRLRYSV